MDLIKKNINAANIVFIAECIFIFVFSLMFQALSFERNILLLSIFAILGIILEKRFRWDMAYIFIIAAGVITSEIDLHAGVDSTWYTTGVWLGAYLLGKYIVGTNKEILDKKVFIVVAVMLTGLYIQGLLNYGNYKGTAEEISGDGLSWGTWSEFFTGQNTSRTLFVFDFILTGSLIFFALVNFKKSKILSIIILLLNAGIVFVDNILAGGRLALLLQFITLVVMTAIYLVKNHQRIPQWIKKAVTIIAVIIVAIGLIVTFLKAVNFYGFADYYAGTIWGRDGGIFNNIRFQTIKEGLMLSFSQPWGGWMVPSEENGIPHNVCLLFSKEYDTFVYLLLVAFRITGLYYGIKLISRKECNNIDYMLFSMLVTINIYFIVETGPWRYRNYWFFFFMIVAMIKKKLEIISEQ